MIKLFRIDERLIHGQIAIKWSRHTGVDHIVVANDSAGIKTAIKTVDDSIKLLNDPRCEGLKILVLVNCPSDALKVVKAVSGIPYINVGNYGRVAPEKPGKPRKAYGNNIYCDDDEIQEFRELLATGLKCEYQTTPEEPVEDLAKVLK